MSIRGRMKNNAEDEGRRLLYIISFNPNIKSVRYDSWYP